MKRAAPLLALSLAAALLLTGCASILEQSYVSSTAHVDYSVTEDESVLRAETYESLVNSILYYVNSHSLTGSIRLYNYTGDVESDLSDACDEVLTRDPLGCYAVRSLSCDHTRILSYYEVTVHIAYSRTAEEVDAIRDAAGLPGLRREIARAVEDREGTTLRVSSFTGDASLVEQLFWLAYYSAPGSVLTPPGLSVSLYPEQGLQRIVEIVPDWHDTPAELTGYAQQLEQAAGRLMDAAPPAGSSYTVDELAAMLRAAALPQEDPAAPEGTPEPTEPAQTALAALTGQPSADTGLLLGMEYLCQQTGGEAGTVMGTGPDGRRSTWLIVSTPEGYRHLLPAALRSDLSEAGSGETGEDAPPPPVPLYTDEELSALGYQWPSFLHPACVRSEDASSGADEAPAPLNGPESGGET